MPYYSHEGYLSPSTANSSDLDQPFCQPSPISSFDPHSTLEKAEKERGIIRSPIDRALDLARTRARGELLRNEAGGKNADWIEFEATPSQYLDSRHDLERLGVRYDYDPLRCLLVLRMPTSVHDVFTNELLDKITAWVRGLRADRPPRAVQNVISNIVPAATSDFKLTVPQDSETVLQPKPKRRASYKHSPDGQYHYLGSRHPPFVIETGYNQQRKDLPALAKHYYEDGSMKTVLTVDLESTPRAKRKTRRREDSAQSSRRQTRSVSRQQKTSAASFSLYRGPKGVVSNRLFRDEAGNHVHNEGLHLHLSDFIPDAVLDTLSLEPDPTLHIPSSELFNILVKSELVQKDRDTTRTPSPSLQPAGQGQKRKVEWVLETDDDEDQNKDNRSNEQEDTSGKRSASSKRRRLSDTVFSSSSRPSALPLMRTRSRSRGQQGLDSG